MEIVLDRFHPRPYQQEFVNAFESGKYNRFVIIHPRRAGKDQCGWNLLIRAALRRPGNYFYVFPTAVDGRSALFESLDNEGRRVVDYYLPKELCLDPKRTKNKSLMKFELKNGSTIRIIGSNNGESLVGSNAAGIVFSEFAKMSMKSWELVQPILRGSGGFCIFLTTVRGQNFFYDLYNNVKNNPEWYTEHKTIEDTKHISLEEIEKDIKFGIISRPMALQEYFNRWDVGSSHCYYSEEMNNLRNANRFTSVPYDPYHEVYTSWDLGYNDDTVIIWFQVIGNSIHIIDYYENSRKDGIHYANIIKDKPYRYKYHFAPHDIAVHEWSSGIGRWQTMFDLGITFFKYDKTKYKVMRSLPEGIEEVRKMLPRCYFDIDNCKQLIKHLEEYEEDYNETTGKYMGKPAKNGAQHACFVGDTPILMYDKSEKAIKDIVIGDYVMTPFGKRKVIGKFSKKVNKTNIVKSNDILIECTPDHKFFTNNGVVESDALRYNEVLTNYSAIEGYLWKMIRLFTGSEFLEGFKKTCMNLNAENSFSLMGYVIDGMKNITSKTIIKKVNMLALDFIELSGLSIMGKYLMAIIYTILMAIEETIVLKICNAYPNMITYPYMQKENLHGLNPKNASSYYWRNKTKLKNGMQVKKVINGIVNTLINLYQFLKGLNILKIANIVSKILWRILHFSAFVIANVSDIIMLLIKLIILNLLALVARLFSWVKDLLKENYVVVHVEFKNHDQEIEVYDLTVEQDNCYYVNKILVSNCDAFRYLAVHLQFTKSSASVEDVRNHYNMARYGNRDNDFNQGWRPL